MPLAPEFLRAPDTDPIFGGANRWLQLARAQQDFAWLETENQRRFKRNLVDIGNQAAFSGMARSGAAATAADRAREDTAWDRLTRQLQLRRFMEDLTRAGIQTAFRGSS